MLESLIQRGFLFNKESGRWEPGIVIKLLAQLRSKVGVIDKIKKPGMKFMTRSNEDLVDAVRPAANELGLLIYPSECTGTMLAVEDGTLASVNLCLVVQAIEDGSAIRLAGFGLGADSQDKAGGKAGTYAFKQALLQGLLANGADDTDDDDAPIKGGVRPKAIIKPGQSVATVDAAFRTATSVRDYTDAKELFMTLEPTAQLKLYELAKETKARVGA